LRIALDATYAIGDELSGVGLYSREILAGLAALQPEAQFEYWLRPHRFFRAAGLAQLRFHEVPVPAANLVGKPGFALSHVAPVGLQYGRISTACSSLGLLRACFEESTDCAVSRKVGGQRVGDLGMIQSLIAEMGANLEAAGLLCWSACRAEDNHIPETFTKTFIAKYFTSRAAVQAASDAVQIHGASGCHESSGGPLLPRGQNLGDHRGNDPGA